MKRCSACNGVIIGSGYRDEGHVFCSHVCFGFSPSSSFCHECEMETTPDPAGRIYLHGFLFGTSLLNAEHRCPNCHSIVQRKFLHVLVPFPRGRFRVIYRSGTIMANEFVSRRVREPLVVLPRNRKACSDEVTAPKIVTFDPRRWWVAMLGGLFLLGWGIEQYVTLTDIERSGGIRMSNLILDVAYRLGGKWTVVAILEAAGAAIVLKAMRLRRAIPPSTESSARNAA